jgi:hypothetical protein
MAVAAMLGLGSGAIHAVTGPDHTLSLMPLSAGRPARAFRVGLLWGVGHSIGTLSLALALMFALAQVELDWLSSWSERAAGLALLVMGLRSLLSAAPRAQVTAEPATLGPLSIGLIHGLTGAAALVLVLPSLAAGSLAYQAVYLAAFSLGSSIAMGALTWCFARLAGQALTARAQRRVMAAASWGSVLLGACWLLLS